MFPRINQRRILRSHSGSGNEVFSLSLVVAKKLVRGARIVYEVSGVNRFGIILKVITAEYGGRMYRVLNEDTGQKEDVARIRVLRVYSRDLQQLCPCKTINISIHKQGVSNFDYGLVHARLRAIADIIGNLDNQQMLALLKAAGKISAVKIKSLGWMGICPR